MLGDVQKGILWMPGSHEDYIVGQCGIQWIHQSRLREFEKGPVLVGLIMASL